MKLDAASFSNANKALTLEELERQKYSLHLGNAVHELHIALRIDNLSHIARVYGNGAAVFVQQEIQAYFTALIDEGYFESGSVTRNASGVFLLVLRGSRRGKHGQNVATRFAQALMVLGCTPMEFGGSAILAAVTCRSAVPQTRPSQSREARIGETRPAEDTARRDAMLLDEARENLCNAVQTITPASDAAGWADIYRRDMADAVEFFARIHNDGLLVAWQPIRANSDPDHVLYNEALLRGIDSRGELVSQAAAIQSLERLGMIGALDYLMVDHAMLELQNAPEATIGINISALSARLDPWWSCIFAVLTEKRDIAGRLYIELTETAAIASRDELLLFARALQTTDCSLVVDDFGVGNASFWALFGLSPQVVKIDGSFLRRALNGERNQQILLHLTGLAKVVASVVVVEGVEFPELAQIARAHGIDWQQGYYHGRPSMRRPWALATDAVMPSDVSMASDVFQAAMASEPFSSLRN